MRMLILTTAAALTLSGVAHAEDTRSFTHEGQTYDYVVTQKGAAKVIAGKRDDGTRFRFTVRGDRVRGTLGNQQVSFGLDEVERTGADQAKKLAAR
jgi:hypothetical protein